MDRKKMPADVQDELITALKNDHTTAQLEQRDQAMLDYAYKLTVTPAKMTAQDVTQLRTVGFTDRAIHDICAITGYFAFVNRIADGLGVQVESD